MKHTMCRKLMHNVSCCSLINTKVVNMALAALIFSFLKLSFLCVITSKFVMAALHEIADHEKQQCSAASSHFKVICYVPLWKLPSGHEDTFKEDYLDPFQCSVIAVAYLNLKAGPPAWTLDDITNGREKEFYKNLVKLKKVNPSLRILLAVGGYADSFRGRQYIDLISSEVNTKDFALNVIKFLNALDADGIAFQMQFPGERQTSITTEREYLGKFAKIFCPFLQDKGLICKISLMRVTEGIPEMEQLPNLEPLKQIVKHADLVGLWTEDIPPPDTSFQEIWHTDMLYPPAPELNIKKTGKIEKFSMDHFVKIFTENVLDKSDQDYTRNLQKLVLTIPFQSNAFDLTRYWKNPWPSGKVPNPPALGERTNSGFFNHLLNYAFGKVCKNVFEPGEPNDRLHIKSHYTNPDGIKSSPVAYNQHILIPTNDPESVRDKVEYARKMGLGGVSLFQLASDDIRGWCYNQSFPLLNAVNNVLGECRQF